MLFLVLGLGSWIALDRFDGAGGSALQLLFSLVCCRTTAKAV